MSEVIERAARLIAPSAWSESALRVTDPSANGGNWVLERRDSLVKARAVLEALREPTEAMLDAASWKDGEVTARVVWGEMLDAALKDQK